MSRHSLVAIVLLAASACSGSSSPSASSSGTPAGTSGGNGSGTGPGTGAGSTGGAGTTSGIASGTGGNSGTVSGTGSATGGSASGASSTSGGTPDAGPVFVAYTLSLPGQDAGVTNLVDDPDAGQLWVVSSGAGPGAISAVTVFDDTTFALISNAASFQTKSGGYDSLALASDLGKVYVATTEAPDGGCFGQVEAIDETTFAVTPVAQVKACNFIVGDVPQSLAYDPVQQRLYASISQAGGGGYLYAIDGPSDQVIATLYVPDAGWGSQLCANASSTSCFGETGFGHVSVDQSGQNLYLLGADQNFYPMAATFVLASPDGGALENILGGHAAGWETANGSYGLLDAGVVFVGLSDGGGFGASFMQFLDPSAPPLPPGQTETAASAAGCFIWAATIDATCNLRVLFWGKPEFGGGAAQWNEQIFIPAGEFPQAQIQTLSVSAWHDIETPLLAYTVDALLESAGGTCGPGGSTGQQRSSLVYRANIWDYHSMAAQCP